MVAGFGLRLSGLTIWARERKFVKSAVKSASQFCWLQHEVRIYVIDSLCCLRERKQSCKISKKSRTVENVEAKQKRKQLCKLSAFHFSFRGRIVYENGNLLEEYFILCPSAIFLLLLFWLSPPSKQFLFNFYILCLCCAHAFNGLANVWEVRVLIHEVNVIPFWCVWWDCKQCPFETAPSAIFHHGFSKATLRCFVFAPNRVRNSETKCEQQEVQFVETIVPNSWKDCAINCNEFSAWRPWNQFNTLCHHQLVAKIVNSVHITSVAHLLSVANDINKLLSIKTYLHIWRTRVSCSYQMGQVWISNISRILSLLYAVGSNKSAE